MSALLAREDTIDRATSGTWQGYLLAALPARSYRQEAQRIARDPTPEDPSHLQVIGNKTKARRRLWAESARWVIEPK